MTPPFNGGQFSVRDIIQKGGKMPSLDFFPTPTPRDVIITDDPIDVNCQMSTRKNKIKNKKMGAGENV